MSVKDTYGINSVTKFECIGHVQKRVGSHLRKLKIKTKGLSGKGKLTDNFIDRLQNYCGIDDRSNVGNLNAMQQNVIAALYHCASIDVSQRSSSPRLIEDETFNDSDMINNLINYEDRQEARFFENG
ncbi:uncharacterized protein TNCV_668171 [Trichonephila clavipes]|nr:uncharacterized protein TNCV_668171 [Trichonephila clavipes]